MTFAIIGGVVAALWLMGRKSVPIQAQTAQPTPSMPISGGLPAVLPRPTVVPVTGLAPASPLQGKPAQGALAPVPVTAPVSKSTIPTLTPDAAIAAARAGENSPDFQDSAFMNQWRIDVVNLWPIYITPDQLHGY